MREIGGLRLACPETYQLALRISSLYNNISLLERRNVTMATTSARYLSQLHQDLDKYFSLDEVRTICFQLGIDHENIPGNYKSAFIRNLVVSLARQNRLQELVDEVRMERPRVNWADVPADFELPAPIAQEELRQVVQYHVYGDYVGGDKVEGDKITVGNISGSTVAIGRGAQASSTTYETGSRPDLQQLFSSLQRIVTRENPALSNKVSELQYQVSAGSRANDSQVAGLIADIAEGAPAAKEALLALFQNPAVAAAAGPVTLYQLQRLDN